MDVGVRELKRRLSEYLERAARGEVIRVTHRGKPKALIVPVPDRSRIERGIEEGWIHPGSAASVERVQRTSSRRSALELLREDREDR